MTALRHPSVARPSRSDGCIALAVLLSSLLLAACASTSKEKAAKAPGPEAGKAAESVAVVPAAPVPPDAPAQSEPAQFGAAQPEAKKPNAALPPTLVVIENGREKEGKSRSLAEAARQARTDRAKGNSGPSRLVITDKNLKSLATGKVTVLHPGNAAAPAEASNLPADATPHDETYWRDRARELRLRWRRADDEIHGLEQEVEGLRRRFYAEDDPYVRDGQIKPAWDRAVERLRQAREDASARHKELEAFLEEGRREGALPGWLREGIELEPETPADAHPEEPDDPMRHRPQDPKVIDP